MTQGIREPGNIVADVVQQRTFFNFDAQLYQYDPTMFLTKSGVPAYSAPNTGIAVTNAEFFSHRSFLYGALTMRVRIDNAPAAGHDKVWGLTSPTSEARNELAYFLISGVAFRCISGSHFATSQETTAVTWNAAWTGQYVDWTIVWTPDDVQFMADGAVLATHRVPGKLGNLGVVPQRALPLVFSEGNNNPMYLQQVVVTGSAQQVDLGGAKTSPLAGGQQIVYGSPNDGVTAKVVPVQQENLSAPDEVLQVGGATGPVPGGLTKALKLRTDQGSYDALVCTLGETTALLDDAQGGPGQWTGSANVTGITSHGGGLEFDKTGVTEAFAMVSTTAPNGLQNLDHFYHGYFRVRCRLTSVTTLARVTVRLGTSSANYGEWVFDDGLFADVGSDGFVVLEGRLSEPTTVVGTWAGILQGANYLAFRVEFDAVGNTLNDIVLSPLWTYGALPVQALDPQELRSVHQTVNAGGATLAGTPYQSMFGGRLYVKGWKEALYLVNYTKGDETSIEFQARFSRTDTSLQYAESVQDGTSGSGTVTIRQKEYSIPAPAGASDNYLLRIPLQGDYLEIFGKRSGGADVADPTIRDELYLHNRGMDGSLGV